MKKTKQFAKIIIDGTIEKENKTYNQEWILETIEDLEDKKNNMGILVYIDSPGGGVYESDEVYKALLRYKRKANKPVYAYFASLAASGGYYIGLAADRIFANINTLTGSIGVISGQFWDASSLMDKVGVKARYIQSGRNKTMGDFTTPMTEEQIAIMHRISAECYEQFTEIVAESRKLDLEKVKKIADGRVYTAQQALELGLVDVIADYDEAGEMIEKELGMSLTEVEYKYKKKKSLAERLFKTESLLSANIFSQKLSAKTPFPAFFFDV